LIGDTVPKKETVVMVGTWGWGRRGEEVQMKSRDASGMEQVEQIVGAGTVLEA
jgi:hypothetical protein